MIADRLNPHARRCPPARQWMAMVSVFFLAACNNGSSTVTDSSIGPATGTPVFDNNFVLADRPSPSVCDRTDAVKDAIRNAVNEDQPPPCADITRSDLANIFTVIDISDRHIGYLRSGDFNGLTNLTALLLKNIGLTTLPNNMLNDLNALISLDLTGNAGLTIPPHRLDPVLDTLEVLNVDGGLKGTLTFSAPTGNIPRGGSAILAVQLDKALPVDISVRHLNPDFDTRFSGTLGHITFPAGHAGKKFFNVRASTGVEPGDTVAVMLNAPVVVAGATQNSAIAASLAVTGSPNTLTLTVTDTPTSHAALSGTGHIIRRETSDIYLNLTDVPANPGPATVTYTLTGTAAPDTYSAHLLGDGIGAFDELKSGGVGSFTIPSSNFSHGANEVDIFFIADGAEDQVSPFGSTIILTITGIAFSGAPDATVAISPDSHTLTIVRASRAQGAQADSSALRRHLMSQTHSLALSTAESQTGMMSDLVRQRINAPARQNGIGLSRLPDETADPRDLLRSLPLHASGTLDSGGRYALWANRINGDLDGANFGLERTSPDGRDLHGMAVSIHSTEASFADSGTGIGDLDGARQWPRQWKENMAIFAPYVSRKTGAMELWATTGIGTGRVDLSGGSSTAAAVDSRLTFLNAGIAHVAAFSSGLQVNLEARALAVRKSIDGFQLGNIDVPAISSRIARMSSQMSVAWPLALAGGTARPHIGADFSGDFADLLPGRRRRAFDSQTGVAWERGTLDASLKGSGFFNDPAGEAVRLEMRWGF